MVTFCGRWEASWTMGWWVSSEKVMVTWVWLGIFTQFLVTFCERWKTPWTIGLLSFIWERYDDLSKFRYFHTIFLLHSVEGEKHLEQSFWVSSEKVMVTWLRLGTFTQSFGYIIWKVISTINHGLVSFIWESYDDLSKVMYFHPIFWLHSVEGENHHELDWWVSSEKVMMTE